MKAQSKSTALIERINRALSLYNSQRNLVFRAHTSANDSMMQAKWDSLEHSYGERIAAKLKELDSIADEDLSGETTEQCQQLITRFNAIRRAYAHQLEITSYKNLIAEGAEAQGVFS
jgi:hypothetical protein